MFKRALLVVALLTVAGGSHAAIATGGGPRVGFSVDPDQLLFGGQLVIGEVAPSLTFDPSMEVGFGDNVTTIALNFDLHYHVAIQNSDWRPYFGAGLGVHFYDFDRAGTDDTSTEVGGGLLLGVGVPTRSGNRFFSEMRIGLSNSVPQLKMVAGWNFRL